MHFQCIALRLNDKSNKMKTNKQFKPTIIDTVVNNFFFDVISPSTSL